MFELFCVILFVLPVAVHSSASSSASNSTFVDYTSIQTARGDQLPDFSFCGYHSSELSLPSSNKSPSATLQPASGDQTAAIQNALDKVSNAGGGVVALAAGTYQLSAGLMLSNNTILSGAGIGKTILTTNNGSASVVTMGSGKGTAKLGNVINITNTYVPVGATNVTLQSTSGLSVGMAVYIQRAVTQDWIDANGMDGLVRDGTAQTWIEAGTLAKQPRKIVDIRGNTVTLDIPLTDALNSEYMSPQLVPYTPPSIATEMGVENLSITLSPTCSGRILTDESCSGQALDIAPWSIDSFARSLNLTGFNSFIAIEPNAFRHTLIDIAMNRDGPTDNGAGYALDIDIEGSQVLVSDCSSTGNADAKSFPVATAILTPGPNAVLRFFSEQADMQIMPHQRWAHGFLVDNSTASLALFNRATDGTGHGWAITSGVGWNVQGDLTIESPPLGVNWCVGCQGAKEAGTNGTFVSYGEAVTPVSLFEAQLAARNGG